MNFITIYDYTFKNFGNKYDITTRVPFVVRFNIASNPFLIGFAPTISKDCSAEMVLGIFSLYVIRDTEYL